MTEKDEVITTLKATLLSCQGSISLKQCNRDYREVQGEWIPFEKLGYKSLKDLFESTPGFRLLEGPDKECFVTVAPSDASKHIVQLVAKQKPSKKPNRFSHPQRPIKSSWKPNNAPPLSPWKYSPTKASQDYYKNQKYSKASKANVKFVVETQNTAGPTHKPVRKVSPINIDVKIKTANKHGDSIVKNSQSAKSPVSPVSPNSFKPFTRSNAADRMNALQNKLSSEMESEVFLVDNLREEIKKLSFDNNFKENKSRLIQICKIMNLPDPIIKTCENRGKGRYLSTFDCSIKVGTEYSFSTYPNSLNSHDLAVETAAGQLLKKLHVVALEKSASMPLTSPSVAVERIIKIVSDYPNGVWATGLPDIYSKIHQETLPKNWLNTLKTSPSIKMEEISGLTMLLPITQQDIVSSLSSSSNLNYEDSICPPPLDYPDDSQWNVFIMSANSTVEIWLRIIGEKYSDAFETLNTNMELYFIDNTQPSNNIVKNGWYAVKCEDGWLRARVLSTDFLQSTALCFLVDTGDEESHPFYNLYDLPQQFLTVASQAILCRLAGLEEYSVVEKFGRYTLADKLVGKGLIAEVLQAPDESNDDPTITVVLYDTSSNEDLNLNKELLYQLTHEAKAPRLSHGITEIFVCEVTQNGVVYAQIHNESWKLLQSMMQQVVSGPFPKEALQASCGAFHPKPNTYYLAKSSSGEWRRAFLHGNLINSIDGDTFINVRYVDYGIFERIPVTDLILLERVSIALNSFPIQVLKLALHNVPHLNHENLKRLNELLPRDVPVLCKQVMLGNNAVEIFVRTQPLNVLCSVNNAINMEIELAKKVNKNVATSDPLIELSKKKERIFSNVQSNNQGNKDLLLSKTGIPKFLLPKKGSQFNVYVSLAANPSNFTVQPYQDQIEMNKMMEDLQSLENSPNLNGLPTVGSAYAAYHEKDNLWYRVYVQGILSQTMASIYFCDFGDLHMVEIKMLKELPIEYKKLPAQALKARVSPINKDWSVEDCLRFQELVVEKSFVSIIENIDRDPLHTDEPLLTLNLIDTSTNEDIYINKVLANEARANLT